jgi:hypothetical protein
MLDKDPVWKEYKQEDMDLFLRGGNATQAIAGEIPEAYAMGYPRG